MVISQNLVISKEISGNLKESDLVIEEEKLEPLDDGEFLVQALFVTSSCEGSFDEKEIGQTVKGNQVAKIIKTKNDKFPTGSLIFGNLGWRTYTNVNPNNNQFVYILENLDSLSPTIALGVLGAPGNAAYFGLLETCKIKEGETIAISEAQGAIGSTAGQIAKIKGCTVIGVTNSKNNSEWLQNLGFDYVLIYENEDQFVESLEKASPKGIDCYFDNIGGEISTLIINKLNEFGRIAVCNGISNQNVQSKTSIILSKFAKNQLEMKGFQINQFSDRWFEGIEQIFKWISEDKLRYRENIIDEYENLSKAFLNLLTEDNNGQTIVKIKSNNNVETISVDFKSLMKTFKTLENKKMY